MVNGFKSRNINLYIPVFLSKKFKSLRYKFLYLPTFKLQKIYDEVFQNNFLIMFYILLNG